MTDQVLAAPHINVGEHTTTSFLGMTFDVDTIYCTAIAAVIIIGLALFLRAKVTSGVPNGVQLFFESVTIQMRQQIEAAIGLKIAPFALPIAVTLFVFILISNWLSVVPAQFGEKEFIGPPASDVNFVYALAIVVFLAYHFAGARRRGPLTHVKQTVKGHVAFLAPINIVEEITKPVSLSLRLFGNMFAGGIMVAIIAMFPPYILWAPNALWKLFDLFIGLIQAFIFALLTILYFSQAMELEEERHH